MPSPIFMSFKSYKECNVKMRRGTTPTHTFTLPFDAEIIKSVKVTYVQDGKQVLAKKNPLVQLNGNTATLKLTQEETLMFSDETDVEIQIRILTTGGDTLGSYPMRIPVLCCLDDEVLE